MRRKGDVGDAEEITEVEAAIRKFRIGEKVEEGGGQ